MNAKQKFTLLILIDSSLFIILIYLLYLGMWYEALLPFLLSLGISFWNYPSYKEYFSSKENIK